MENYKTVMTKCQFTPENVYNLDVTGIIAVIELPKAISRWDKQVAQAASAERGQLQFVQLSMPQKILFHPFLCFQGTRTNI